jgi:uncharacterized membrane protein YedE/YeeE
MNLEITTQVILLAGVMGVVLGGVANKTNFCTMGAVSDWVNMGDMSRMRSWFLAIAVAIMGVSVLEAMSLADVASSRVPYRSSTFFWPRYILGGLLFGVGMTLASGCANKNLVRLGGGNLKSIFVLIVVGVMAYLMISGGMYRAVFHEWMMAISPNLSALKVSDQSLGTIVGSLVGMDSPAALNVYAGILVAAVLLFIVFRSSEFRSSMELVIGGLVIGLVIAAGWYVTSGPMGQEWVEFAEFMDEPPPGVGAQSFTFVGPYGELVYYLTRPTHVDLITFGLASLFGVVVGSFLYALFSRSLRIEWFVDFKDFLNHMIGAVLMGIGGVLAIGCTIGQGITGVSTLALGSFVALGSIILGSALTMKIQYYKMVYEEEATFGKALVAGMADLHLLPQSMRKLDAI